MMHDDQHGTAIISGAALLNAVELQGKTLDSIDVVVAGAGASAIACARHYVALGVDPTRVTMCDSKGILTRERLEAGELNQYKAEFAQDVAPLATSVMRSWVQMCSSASLGGLVDASMVASMAPRPIVFALANPNPEITPEEVRSVRSDAIIATGRSDYPNQVNNVLGFPYIFRGALDVRASDITAGMDGVTTRSLADLAKEPVQITSRGRTVVPSSPSDRSTSYRKPFDRRVLLWEASAVASAAVEEGVAGIDAASFDPEIYRATLERRLGLSYSVMRGVMDQVRDRGRRIVFVEGDNEKVIRRDGQAE